MSPFFCTEYWWASRESNTVPTDYESAALTKRELEARNRCDGDADTAIKRKASRHKVARGYGFSHQPVKA